MLEFSLELRTPRRRQRPSPQRTAACAGNTAGGSDLVGELRITLTPHCPEAALCSSSVFISAPYVDLPYVLNTSFQDYSIYYVIKSIQTLQFSLVFYCMFNNIEILYGFIHSQHPFHKARIERRVSTESEAMARSLLHKVYQSKRLHYFITELALVIIKSCLHKCVPGLFPIINYFP